MRETILSTDKVRRRTIRRADWVPCKAAFIDCRTPGSDRKDNYSFIGPGVSQSSAQFVNLKQSHGFNLGAAGMPNGVTNSLHLHFTAEVFINFGGDYQLRWGSEGDQGGYRSTDGDVISVPSWIFRGFTNIGPDDGILLTVLGHDDTGGIIWGPSVLEEAAGHGLYLTADNRLVDAVAGEEAPEGVPLVHPMRQGEIDKLDSFDEAQFRARVTQQSDRVWLERPFLCSGLPGGGTQLSLVIGYGMSEDRRATPRLHEPHSFNLSWLRAREGEGMLRHRHLESQVLTAKAGRWRVRLDDGRDEHVVDLDPLDTLSVPVGTWRSLTLVEAGPGRSAEPGIGELLVVNSGDARVRLQWADDVVRQAREAGQVLDPNGYVAPTTVMVTATDDD